MNAISDSLASYRRVQALADVAHRHAATIRGLAAAVEEILPDVDAATMARLEAALADADAQLAATSDALDAALGDLPEGQHPTPGEGE